MVDAKDPERLSESKAELDARKCYLNLGPHLRPDLQMISAWDGSFSKDALFSAWK